MTRRGTFWLDTVIAETVAAGGQGTEDLTGVLSVADRRGLTLVRLIYNLTFLPLDHVDTDSVFELFMGIGLIEPDAAVAGAFPDADIEGDAPNRGWVVRDHGITRSPAGVSGNLILGRLKGDIRAMRIIHQNAQLFIIMDSVAVAGAGQSLRVHGLVRCLFKVP